MLADPARGTSFVHLQQSLQPGARFARINDRLG
jgi:hypothetical protein